MSKQQPMVTQGTPGEMAAQGTPGEMAAQGTLGEMAAPGTPGALGACCSPLAAEPLSESQADGLARMFKSLADPVRLRLLSLIASHAGGEACVCEMTGAFELTGPTISHHLRVLREAGLITGERRGTWVYYRVHPEVLARLSAVLAGEREPAGAAARQPAGAAARQPAGAPA